MEFVELDNGHYGKVFMSKRYRWEVMEINVMGSNAWVLQLQLIHLIVAVLLG